MEVRTVEVVNPRVPMFGSGALVAPGLVLTAYHVACPGGDRQSVTVRDKIGHAAEATIAWADAELDAVLLQTDRTVLGAGLPVARWGELTCDYPDARPVCSMTGFPRAMRRPHPTLPDAFVGELLTVDGNIKPATGSRRGYYGFELVNTSLESAELWQGMSGAGAFCNDRLVGVATFASDFRHGGLLHLMPAARLFASPGFTDTVTAVTGMTPQLQPADLRILLDDVPDPQLSTSYLLKAQSAVVPLTGMTTQLDSLEAWCRTSRPTDVTAVTGIAGIGKTRLITELMHRLGQPRPGNPTARGWTGGFLADNPIQQPPHYRMLATSKYPLLLAVDYAETRRDQVDQVLDVLATRHTSQPVRVLLLARGRGNWWPSLRRARQGSTVMSTGATIDVDPADALVDISTEHAFDTARHAFTERIHALQSAGHGDDWAISPLRPDTSPGPVFTAVAKPADDTVISLHMAALADVLASLNDDFARYDDPMDVLIAHEVSYWRRIVEARGEYFDENLMRTLVAVQAVTGAKKLSNAQAAVTAGFDVHHSGFPDAAPNDRRLLAAYEDILTAAYPSGDGAHWGSMGPDLLGAALVAEVEDKSGGQFIERLLPHPYLEEHQQHRALTVLARSAPTQPVLAAGAARAVAAAPDKLLPLAARTVTAELDTDIARNWLLGLQDALAEQAQQPDADPDLHAWATDLVSTSLTHVETGLGDYFNSTEWKPPQSQPDEEPGTDDGLVDDGDAADEDDLDWDPEDDGDGREENGEETGGGDDDPGGIADPPVGTTSPTPRPTVVVHTITSRAVRTGLTAVALAHLGFVSFVTGSVAYFSHYSSEPSFWLLPPLIICAHLFIGSFYGRRQLPVAFAILIAPPLVLLMTVGFGLMFSDLHGADINPVVMGMVWTSLFSPGMLALTYAFRAWFGQIRFADGR
ncbi:S1 family peptidase [Streptomyces lunaelactis]|uniref:S1 family peptidase n=1 Tax=Streptomyces lunaelactis TaxID=1535768 RepID=UPI001585BA30|nr:serine protease [Streptomyces lunaelactis]NUK17675.1 trypsin-like peptidase domain-containing protein [Streptomyces lunaelactis]